MSAGPSAAPSGQVPLTVRPATESELVDWDDHAVRAPGGHVMQSRAWAAWRTSLGRRRATFWTFSDGGRALVMIRRWGTISGGSGYVARGPAQEDVSPAGPGVGGPPAVGRLPAVGGLPGASGSVVAARLAALGPAVRDDAVDVLAADPEVSAADEAYMDALRRAGFQRIEELQPSRHRMRIPLAPGVDEASVLAGVSKSSRQRIRAAEHDLVVVRHDQGEPDQAAAPEDGVFTSPFEPVEAAFGRLADLLATTGARVGFPFARSEVAWWSLAFESGLLVLLEAREAGQDGEPIASLALYRHGGRISTATSADRVDRRREHPGALHLLRWRAAQLAIGEGASELDLGGVDVAGARHVPEQGDPMYGLYEHKRSFGAEWVELAGSHELVLRPWRYALGRGLARVGRLAGRGTSA